MKPMVVVAIAGVLCRGEVETLGGKDPTRVKIVSKLDPKKYLSLLGGEARLATKERIKENRGCSKFVIDEIETEIQQGARRICRKAGFSKVMSCADKSKSFTWRIEKHDGTRAISFKATGDDGGCLTDDGPGSGGGMGNTLSVRECDGNSSAQKFWVKMIKSRAATGG